MNIKAVELLKINKNMKFGENPTTQIPENNVSETPVTNPESTLNALHQQGLNNVAFQGLKMANIKNFAKSSLVALMLAGSMAPMLQSCEGIEITQSVEVDMAAIMEMYNQMMQLLQQMVEQQKMTNQQLQQVNTFMMGLIEEVKAGNMSMEEFHQKVYEFMIQSTEYQKMILDALIQNGKTQEEANQWLQDLINEVRSGKISYEEAVNKILELLGSIDQTVKDILAQVKQISDQLTQYHEEYQADKAAELELLTKIYHNGKFQTAYLEQLTKGQEKMNENIEKISQNVQALLEIAQDDTKYNELMETLKGLQPNDIDYDRFEEMFKLLNMNLSQVINMSKDELIAAIKAFQQTYVETEKQQSQLLASISNKLSIVINMSNVNAQKLQAALLALAQAMNSGNEDLINELQEIQAQLDQILARLDALLQKVGNLSKNLEMYANMFSNKFDSAIERLINEMKTGFAGIKSEQQITNQYLESLNAKADAMLEELKNLKEQAGGITIEQLENLWIERDEDNYNKYKALIEALGIQIDTTNAKLDDLIAAIESWKQDQKDYTEQLNRIIALLEGIDWSNPDYSAKFDMIIDLIKNFECNCNCGGNKDPNEGIIDDLENLLK